MKKQKFTAILMVSSLLFTGYIFENGPTTKATNEDNIFEISREIIRTSNNAIITLIDSPYSRYFREHVETMLMFWERAVGYSQMPRVIAYAGQEIDIDLLKKDMNSFSVYIDRLVDRINSEGKLPSLTI
jgi:hypothetical protein